MSPTKPKKRPSPLVTKIDLNSASDWSNFMLLKTSLAQLKMSPASAVTPTAWGEFVTIETPTKALITPLPQLFNPNFTLDTSYSIRTPTTRFLLENLRMDSDAASSGSNPSNGRFSGSGSDIVGTGNALPVVNASTAAATTSGAVRNSVLAVDDSIIASVAHTHQKRLRESDGRTFQLTSNISRIAGAFDASASASAGSGGSVGVNAGNYTTNMAAISSPVVALNTLISTPSPWNIAFNSYPLANNELEAQPQTQSQTQTINFSEYELRLGVNPLPYHVPGHAAGPVPGRTTSGSADENNNEYIDEDEAVCLTRDFSAHQDNSITTTTLDWRPLGLETTSVVSYPMESIFHMSTTPFPATFRGAMEVVSGAGQESSSSSSSSTSTSRGNNKSSLDPVFPSSTFGKDLLSPSVAETTDNNQDEDNGMDTTYGEARSTVAKKPARTARTKKSKASKIKKKRSSVAATIKVEQLSFSSKMGSHASNGDADYVRILDRARPGSVVWDKLQVAKKGAYSCTHCSLKFSTIYSFAEHLDEYKIARPYLCTHEDCPWYYVGFQKQSEWKRHLKYQHASSDPYQCPHADCNKAFSRKDSMKRHIALVHENYMSRRNRRIRDLAIKAAKAASAASAEDEFDVKYIKEENCN